MTNCLSIILLVLLTAAVEQSKVDIAELEKARSTIQFAIANDEAVIVHYKDGSCNSLPDTAHATGVALDAENDGVYIAGPHSLRHFEIATGKTQILTDGWEIIDCPAVSPDGRCVAFAAYTPIEKWCIYILHGNESSPIFIAKGLMPAWGRDGKVLYFENYTNESAQVYRHDLQSRDVRKVRYDKDGMISNAVSASINADGRFMSYSSFGNLFIKDQESEYVWQLTDSKGYDSRQQFTPDGRYLYFIRKSIDQHGQRIEPRAMKLNIWTGDVSPLSEGEVVSVAAPHPAATRINANRNIDGELVEGPVYEGPEQRDSGC